MRYAEDEYAQLVGKFDPGQNVTIELLELSNDQLVEVTTNICIESKKIPGIYLWSTENVNDESLVGYSNLLYVMTDEKGATFMGKFIYGGYINEGVKVNLEPVLEHTTKLLKDTSDIHARL